MMVELFICGKLMLVAIRECIFDGNNATNNRRVIKAFQGSLYVCEDSALFTTWHAMMVELSMLTSLTRH